MDKNSKEDITEGPRWRIAGRFSTFELADERRTELLEEENNLQIKVHYQGHPNHRFYAVKTRTDPSIALEEKAAQQRAEKKRRKARLSKKRRKK